MRSTHYLILSGSLLLLGALLGAWHQGWISFQVPWATAALQLPLDGNHSQQKVVTLHFWQDEAWHSETRELLWQNRPARDLKHLVALWLELLNSEQLLPQKVMLQTALVDLQTQTLYLSFDSELFHQQQSTYDKLMMIEGLLKTVRDSQAPITQLYFLQQQQPMTDRHLDFSCAWPIAGFT